MDRGQAIRIASLNIGSGQLGILEAELRVLQQENVRDGVMH